MNLCENYRLNGIVPLLGSGYSRKDKKAGQHDIPHGFKNYKDRKMKFSFSYYGSA
jgi:hypothetical protein